MVVKFGGVRRFLFVGFGWKLEKLVSRKGLISLLSYLS